VAFNAGDEVTTSRHLLRALAEDARHDHAHYMMAVVAVRRGDDAGALERLRQAVSFNPENRSLARQDPEFESLRDDPTFRTIVESAASDAAARPASPQRPRIKSRR